MNVYAVPIVLHIPADSAEEAADFVADRLGTEGCWEYTISQITGSGHPAPVLYPLYINFETTEAEPTPLYEAGAGSGGCWIGYFIDDSNGWRHLPPEEALRAERAADLPNMTVEQCPYSNRDVQSINRWVTRRQQEHQIADLLDMREGFK